MLRWTLLIFLIVFVSGIVAVGRFGGEVIADGAIVIFLAGAFILFVILAALAVATNRD